MPLPTIVIRFIEFLEFKVSKPIDSQEKIKPEEKEISFAEVAKAVFS